MSGIEGVGSRVRLSREDDETTQAIVERDTKVSIEGQDQNWRELKEHQQTVRENLGCLALHAGHAALEGAEMSGLSHSAMHHVFRAGLAGAESSAAVAVGAGLVITGAVGGFFLGVHELYEAHEKGDAQNAALVRDNAHVALIFNLDLPPSYSNKRLNGDFKHVEKQKGPAFDQMRSIQADTKGRALLQLHADRGMNAGRDWAASGMTEQAFLKANPNIAAQCAKDAAFKEGFDAFVHTTKHGTIEETNEMNRKLDERDGWYAQDQVRIRV